MVVFTGNDDSQLMVLSAKAEDANAVVASTAAVKVTSILMMTSFNVVRPCLVAGPGLRPLAMP
jgi:hypothetical protein